MAEHKIGKRGKWAEGKMRDALKAKAESSQNFNFARLPDARAGSFQPTIADFLLVDCGLTTFLEVKEVDHEYRLPRKNLDDEQCARLRLWNLAKARTTVVVHFTPLRAKCSGKLADQLTWRMAPAAWFVRGVPSWDMSGLPLLSLNQVIGEICS